MNLSSHFTLAEFVRSQLAARSNGRIINDPPADLYPALKRTAEGLERIREVVGGPIIITSGYRSAMLNLAIGGTLSSQHQRGEAADIYVPGMTAAQLARRIDDNRDEIQYDQLILEYPPDGWVHVSFTARPRVIAITRTPAEYLRGIQA